MKCHTLEFVFKETAQLNNNQIRRVTMAYNLTLVLTYYCESGTNFNFSAAAFSTLSLEYKIGKYSSLAQDSNRL